MTDEETLELKYEPGQEKLTDWEKEPSITTLKCDLEAAKGSHDTFVANLKRWNDLLNVTGSAKPKKIAGRSSVQPKLIRRQAEWRYPALTEPFLSSSKLFKASPTTFEDTSAARQNELLLNWQFRTKLNRVNFIDNYVRSTVDEGTSIVRTGWRRVTKMVTETVPVYAYYAATTDEEIQALNEALQLKLEDPRTYKETVPEELQEAADYFIESGQPNVAKITGYEDVEVEKVLVNQPEVEVFDPANVTIDPSCNGDISKAMFAVFTIEVTQAGLLAEGDRYKNLKQVRWDEAGPITDVNHTTKTPQDFQFKDAMRKRVVAYEYWGFYDIHGTGELVPIVATWIGDVLVRLEENPFPDGELPIVVVPYLPKKREVTGEPDAELLEDNQSIVGAVSRGMIDLLGRSANSQQGFAKGMLDPLNKRRFDSGQDYEFNPSQNPQNMHIMHKFPELPQSAFMMLNIQNYEAEALTGVKSFSGGLSGEAYGDVAAGVRGLLDAAAKREMSILRRLAWGMKEIGRKIAAMNAVFLSEEEVVRVTNEEFVTVRREDLKGDFDWDVDISTAEVDAAQSADLERMLQTMGPNMDINMTKMILGQIADLKRMPELAQQIRAFEPQPDPVEEQRKQLEVLELQKKIEKLQSEIDKNNAEAGVRNSEKNKNNLDFVEQETGTAHAREIENSKAQARGNQDLEVTKALLNPRKPDESQPNIAAAIGYRELSDRRE